jgi:hypothetical protein
VPVSSFMQQIHSNCQHGKLFPQVVGKLQLTSRRRWSVIYGHNSSHGYCSMYVKCIRTASSSGMSTSWLAAAAAAPLAAAGCFKTDCMDNLVERVFRSIGLLQQQILLGP